MAFIDKLKFWEKKDEMDDLDIPKEDDFSKDEIFGVGSESVQQPPSFGTEPNYSSPQQPSYQQPAAPQPQQQMQQPTHPVNNSKDMEIISAKLDALRATLDSINQRLANLERVQSGKNW